MSGDPVLSEMLRTPESSRLALVSREGGREEVARAVCAMLNSDGGSVVFGASHGGGTGPMTEDDASLLAAYLHEHIIPSTLYTVTLDPGPRGNAITVDVPVGEDRPYVFDGTVFIRHGARTVAADGPALRQLVEDRAATPERWERRAAAGLTMDDLARELIDRTMRQAVEKRGYFPDTLPGRNEVLKRWGLEVRGRLTNACDVVFGREVASRNPQTRVRVVRYRTDRDDDFLDEQVLEGPALHLLQRTMEFLQRNVPVASEFEPGRVTRLTRPQYPFSALREGLVNALVHRDYASSSGSVSVSIYPQRLEIWNAGRLPDGVSISDLPKGTHRSILVNPDIGHMFYLNGLMERVGRGTFKIVQDCKAAGLPAPKWRQEHSGVSLGFSASPVAQDSLVRLNNRQRTLLEDLHAGEFISLREYVDRYANHVTDRSARRDLAALADAGYLLRSGAAASTTYCRTKQEPQRTSGHHSDTGSDNG